MESKLTTSGGFNMPIHPRECQPVRRLVLFRGQQSLGASRTMINRFCRAKKLIVLPKDMKFNQRYSVHYAFPDLKKANLSFTGQRPRRASSVHMDDPMSHNESKVASKFKEHHLYRMPHPPYSPDLSPCDCWLFGLLKRILKDREFN
jgi:hypothetical protein